MVRHKAGDNFTQHAATRYQPHDTDWDRLPRVRHFDRTAPVRWKCLGHEREADFHVRASGRLIGGTLDVIGPLCGSQFGDVRAFGQSVAPDRLLVYLDSCDYTTAQYCRALHQLRLAGWFDHATAVLIGRTGAQRIEDLSQRGALLDAFDGMTIPVIYDMDIGHLPPQLLLVNGASATLDFGPARKTVTQRLA